jgi:hypothetical protein
MSIWLLVRGLRGWRRFPRFEPVPSQQGSAATHVGEVQGTAEQASTAAERIDVHASHLAARVKDLVHEGNVRRLVVKDASGTTVLDAPVSVGVVGALAAPKLAALGALAAIATNYSIEVEREHTGTTAPVVATT